jgi:hypothetical protein
LLVVGCWLLVVVVVVVVVVVDLQPTHNRLVVTLTRTTAKAATLSTSERTTRLEWRQRNMQRHTKDEIGRYGSLATCSWCPAAVLASRTHRPSPRRRGPPASTR